MRTIESAKKLMGLAPAGMARLPNLINTKKFLLAYDLVRQLGLHLLLTCIALQGKVSIFD
jgi:hypothetical protein